MRNKIWITAGASAAAAIVLMAGTQAQDSAGLGARLAAAQERLAAIDARTDRVDDVNQIQNLQRSYGYYLDKMLWEHVLDLLTDDATMERGASGVYAGKDSIRAYLYSLSGGIEGPLDGVLYNHMQLQPVISLAEDGLSAKGRWRALVLAGTSGEDSGGQWGEGPYENEYVKEDGIWKISAIRWYPSFIAPYEGGWLEVSDNDLNAHTLGRGVEPDRPQSDDYQPYPAAYTAPFHYPNPVSGE